MPKYNNNNNSLVIIIATTLSCSQATPQIMSTACNIRKVLGVDRLDLLLRSGLTSRTPSNNRQARIN